MIAPIAVQQPYCSTLYLSSQMLDAGFVSEHMQRLCTKGCRLVMCMFKVWLYDGWFCYLVLIYQGCVPWLPFSGCGKWSSR